MEELRECPFCGGKAQQSYVGAKYIIICPNCVKLPADGGYIDSKDAVTAWNTRHDNWIKFEIEANEGEEKTIISPIPDDEQEVLVTDGVGVWQDTFMIDDGCYFDSGYEIIDSITHWRPLPEPPKGSEN